MSSERETCGLGSFIPMNCRGRAEAFARRLQSRLQTLGRSTSGLDESADESSWIGRQPSVTSCQPRLSSSSDSDIFFDFDLDAPGSPEEVATPSSASTNQFPQCVDSGSVLSPSTTERASPASDESSDERYFDPESSDCESSRSELSGECKRKITSPVVNDENKGSNFAVICNGHIAKPSTDNSNIRSNGDRHYTSTPATERCNKINLSKLEALHIEEKNHDCINCCVLDRCEDCTTGVLPTSHENVELVPGKDTKGTGHTFCEESINKTDEHSQNAGFTGNITTEGHENDCGVMEGRVEDNIEKFGGSGISSLPDVPVCSCRTYIMEDQSSELDRICEDGTDALLMSNENINVSVQELDSNPHCYSTFNRPKNLLIDCAVLSSDIEQLSVLVPLRIDSAENIVLEEAAETESIPSVDTESQKNTDDEVNDIDDERPRRVRRSSSLKSGKTPPGTPGRKKIVRFADVLGLDLADVRTFLDEVPWVPQSAYQDLQDVDLSDTTGSATQSSGSDINAFGARRADKCLVPMFQQPGNQAEFLDRVRERQVCLESAVVTDTIFFTISGVVRVRNLDFHKSVYIRYSLDGWKTFSDLQASYVDGSCDGFSDKFSFKLYAHTVNIGSKVEFAIRFQCKGTQYWDSNFGANYTFQCLPSITPSTNSLPFTSPIDDTWPASFY